MEKKDHSRSEHSSGNKYYNSFNIKYGGLGRYTQNLYNNQGDVNVYNEGGNQNQERQIGSIKRIFRIALFAILVGLIYKYWFPEEDTVVDRVWEVISESQSFGDNDWLTLAQKLKVNVDSQADKKNLKAFLRNQTISWGRLKGALYEMEKDDLVEELKKKTNLTKGFTHIIREHKRRTLEEAKRKKMHPEYVELVVVEGDLVDKRWKSDIDDKEFMYMKFNVPRTDYKNIILEKLIDEEDSFVLVNGIAGVGKSTLNEEIKYRWSAGSLWNGENGQPHVPLLLSISCRMMNIKKFKSITEFIFYLLPQVDLKLLEDKKALLVIDGADELQGIENLSSLNNCKPNLTVFCEIINFPVQRFFNKIIITSRPRVTSQLRKFCREKLREKLKTKDVEITGFSSESISSFVERRFQGKPKLLREMKRRINENSIIEAMASIPLFLDAFCNLFIKPVSIRTPSTMTELLLYTILMFFQKFYEKKAKQQQDLSIRDVTYDEEDLSIKRLTNNEEVIKQVVNLAELSYKTLMEKKVIFFKDDIGIKMPELVLLDDIGFITKVKDPVEGNIYQYRHLTFQEIFTALFIMRGNTEFQEKCFEDENLQDTLPFISGLEGILKRVGRDHLKTFTQKVTGRKSPVSDVKKFIEKTLINKKLTYNRKSSVLDIDLNSLYYKCQSENLEFPSQNFIEKKMQICEIRGKSALLRECKVKLWNFILPHVKDLSFKLFDLQKLDNVEHLGRISCKSSSITLTQGLEDDDEHWIKYFKQLSDHCVSGILTSTDHTDQFENVKCHFNLFRIQLVRWKNDVTDVYARFLWYVSALEIDSVGVLPWLKYLVNGMNGKAHLKKLTIDSQNSYLTESSSNEDVIMEMVGKLCKKINFTTKVFPNKEGLDITV